MTQRSPAVPPAANIGVVQADGSGEGILAEGPNDGFGIGGPMSWVGSAGMLLLNECVAQHEYLTFDTAQAPFTRSALDGSDETL